jgi:hypothetical protein
MTRCFTTGMQPYTSLFMAAQELLYVLYYRYAAIHKLVYVYTQCLL